jgi:hypothetical protein
MTDEQMNVRFDRLEATLDRRFGRIEDRLEHLERSAVTRFDLFQSVIVAQGVFYAGALAMVVVLNAIGAFG